jgi:membrane carboxypeptidase/penicillin-binding protein
VAEGDYTPHNYNRESYGGRMSLYYGLTKSRNVFTVILANKIGMPKVIDLASKLGVSDYIPNQLCVSLGSAETTVLRIAGAYAALLNGGYAVKPTLFLNVASYFGPFGAALRGSRVAPIAGKGALKQIKSMLVGCVTNGTGAALRHLMNYYPITVCGKTGTSNDFKDAWFVGGIELCGNGTSESALKPSRPLVFAVFIGFPSPASLGLHNGGARVAIPAIQHFVEELCAPLRKGSAASADEPGQPRESSAAATDEPGQPRESSAAVADEPGQPRGSSVAAASEPGTPLRKGATVSAADRAEGADATKKHNNSLFQAGVLEIDVAY